MEELYSIMRDLLEVEYNQKSMLYILQSLESSYNEETQADVKLVTNSIKYYLNALQEEIRGVINRMDDYTIKESRK